MLLMNEGTGMLLTALFAVDMNIIQELAWASQP